MSTLTYTQRWDRITMWSIGTFIVGFAGMIAIRIADILSALELAFMLASIVGLIMSHVSAPRVFGGLKTGITGLITGAVFWIFGRAMLENVESSTIIGVEFPDFASPLFIIGTPLHNYGLLLLIIGAIMTIATYLRRVLKAVESKSAPEGRVAPHLDEK